MKNKILRKRDGVLFVVLLLWMSPANPDPIDVTLNTGLEGRAFLDSPRFESQVKDVQISASLQPEIKWQSDDRHHRASFIAFGRHDNADDERTHGDIRELFYSYTGNEWTFTAGTNKVFWGVTESVQLVDVINQTDFIEDIDQEDKLGQPMLQTSVQKDWGRVEFFILPYFRERTFSSDEGRFYTGLAINEHADYESDDEQGHLDFALRYSHYFGDIDVGLHVFEGTNREPQFRLEDNATLTPFYSQMTQVGIDLQYTIDAWLFKLEALQRQTDFDEFAAAVAGFEYTLFQFARTNRDLGLIFEYQFDERNQQITQTLADNDIFIGVRLGFNDIQDTSVIAGIVVDAKTSSKLLNIEAERRLGSNISAELKLRLFADTDKDERVDPLSRDDYFQLSVNWFY